MNYFSPNFLVLFGIAVLVVILRSRSKNKGNKALPGKQIAIIGRQLETPLGIDTPYICLLHDGRKFGDGFQEKEEPDLPHNDMCQCQFNRFVKRNYDIFAKNPPPEPLRPSDLGDLGRAEARYYKYMLISNHPDASAEERESHTDLASRVDTDPDFAEKVQSHLAKTNVISSSNSSQHKT